MTDFGDYCKVFQIIIALTKLAATSIYLYEILPSSSLPHPLPALAEIGDFDETQSWQHLLHNKYLPDQDDIRDKITECHRKHV